MSKEKIKSEKNGQKSIYGDVLQEIRSAAQALNRAADATTRDIEFLEHELLECEPGVAVWTAAIVEENAVYAGPNGSQEAIRVVKLGFSKAKKWGLVVSEEFIAADGSVLAREEESLRKADRDTRLAAAPHLSSLLERLRADLTGKVARLPVEVGFTMEPGSSEVQDMSDPAVAAQ